MVKADLIIKNISELLTLDETINADPDLGIIYDGAIASYRGTIVFIGDVKELAGSVDKDEECMVVDAHGSVVMPGFVDAHTHLIFDGDRSDELPMKLKGMSYKSIADSGGGIRKTVIHTRKAPLNKLINIGKERLDAMEMAGVTSTEIKTGYGLTTKSELKLIDAADTVRKNFLKNIEITFLGAHAVPSDIRKEDYIDVMKKEMIPEISKKKNVKFIDVFCEEGFFNYDESKEILEYGKKYNMIPKIHADEFSDGNGALLAAQVKAVSADHLLKSSGHGLEEMKKAGVIPVLLPGTILTTFIEVKPNIDLMRTLKMDIAISSDYNPNCTIINPWLLMWLSVYRLKLTLEEAIKGMTINSAKAIAMDKKVGSLKVGKKANLIITDVNSHIHLFSDITATHTKNVIISRI